MPTTITILDGTNTPRQMLAVLDGSGDYSFVQQIGFGSPTVPVTPGNPLPVSATQVQGTWSQPATTTITTGGTSQTCFSAGTITLKGIITNPYTATENLYVNPTGGTCHTTEGGSTFALLPGQSYMIDACSNAVTVNAATTAHAFSAVFQ